MMTLQAAPGRVAIAPRVGSTRKSHRASTPPLGPVASATRMHAVSWPTVAGASVPTGALPVAVSGRNAGRPDVTAHARISNDDKCVHDPTSIIPRPDPPTHDTVTTPTLKKKRVQAQANLPPLHPYPFPPPTYRRWYEAPSPPNFIDVRSEEELRDVMRAAYGNARASTLLVVEFYAKWCNSCRRLYPRLGRLAAQESDVLFVKVEFDECKDLCRKLGVVKLPYFHVYNGSGSRLADFASSLDPAKFKR